MVNKNKRARLLSLYKLLSKSEQEYFYLIYKCDVDDLKITQVPNAIALCERTLMKHKAQRAKERREDDLAKLLD